MKDEEIISRLRMFLSKKIGSIRSKAVIQTFGSAKHFYDNYANELDKANTKHQHSYLKNLQLSPLSNAIKEYELLKKNDIHILFFDHPNYPKLLKDINNAPFVLFYKGNIQCASQKTVSIVGTRLPTEYGKKHTKKIVQEISHVDCCTVSGLAYGIDTITHQESIKYGIPTIAVLGSGLGEIYPKKNKKLAEEMINQGGAVISEYTFSTQADKYHFPFRNRIIAGLSEALLIMETKIKGGSMITAKIAYSYGKPIFCLPGRLDDVKSSGCNYLLFKKQAEILLSGKQLISELFWEEDDKPKKMAFDFKSFSVDEQTVIKHLEEYGKLQIDELINMTNKSIAELSMSLIELEMKNVIECLPGKFYTLK